MKDHSEQYERAMRAYFEKHELLGRKVFFTAMYRAALFPWMLLLGRQRWKGWLMSTSQWGPEMTTWQEFEESAVRKANELRQGYSGYYNLAPTIELVKAAWGMGLDVVRKNDNPPVGQVKQTG